MKGTAVLHIVRHGVAGIGNSRKKVIPIEKVRYMKMDVEAAVRERLFYFW